jgi:hypothetical protein
MKGNDGDYCIGSPMFWVALGIVFGICVIGLGINLWVGG